MGLVEKRSTRRLGSWVATLVAAALATQGCRGELSRPPSPSPQDMGVYAFRASLQVSDEILFLAGTFEATADTVLLELEGAHCIGIPGGSYVSIAYRCEIPASAEVSQATFSFDRRVPARGPSVWATVTTTERETICQRYEKVEGGGMVCVSWTEEVVTRTERRQAELSSLWRVRGRSEGRSAVDGWHACTCAMR